MKIYILKQFERIPEDIEIYKIPRKKSTSISENIKWSVVRNLSKVGLAYLINEFSLQLIVIVL